METKKTSFSKLTLIENSDETNLIAYNTTVIRKIFVITTFVTMNQLDGHLKNGIDVPFVDGINGDIVTNPILPARKSIVGGINGLKRSDCLRLPSL
mgnify:CR=1 FL=1